MHSPFVQPTESHIHAQWEGKKEDLKEGQGKERTLVQTPEEEKKYWDLQNGIMVTFSSLILVVSVENVSIFQLE